MSITRRQLLQAGAVAGAGILTQGYGTGTNRALAAPPGSAEAFTEQLPDLDGLGVIDLTAGGNTTLWMRNARHRFQSGMGLTDTLAYQDARTARTYLGPIIVAPEGDRHQSYRPQRNRPAPPDVRRRPRTGAGRQQ